MRVFPISRDPPEGGTFDERIRVNNGQMRFQFLGIPPKGELGLVVPHPGKPLLFPISRDPPEGGTLKSGGFRCPDSIVSNF